MLEHRAQNHRTDTGIPVGLFSGSESQGRDIAVAEETSIAQCMGEEYPNIFPSPSFKLPIMFLLVVKNLGYTVCRKQSPCSKKQRRKIEGWICGQTGPGHTQHTPCA